MTQQQMNKEQLHKKQLDNKPRNKEQAYKKHTKIDPVLEKDFQTKDINWIPATLLVSSPFLALLLVPWYGLTYGFSTGAWVAFALLLMWNGLGITAGYHRLWSHRTYKASWGVRFFLLIGATLATQSSIFDWCSGHRDHHRYVDDVYKDPYSAKRGFWFSHMGWMLKHYPSGNYDYKNIPDLTADPMLRIQHQHYHWWVFVTNVLMPLAIGWAIGDIWGTLILAGLLRLVIGHHFTFFINSLAHIWGRQPYTDTNTARDNTFLSFITWGEGYHNYHHIFQYDYRNGVKWWQYDPTKWLIFSLHKLGLASDLKRVPTLKIKQAEVAMQFKRAKNRIAVYGHDVSEDFQQFKTRIHDEYDAFSQTLEEWKALKQQAIEAKIAEKKHFMQLEKKALEERFNEKFEQKKESMAQAKANMAATLEQKLQAVDDKLQADVKVLEKRMVEQSKQLSLLIAQFKPQKV